VPREHRRAKTDRLDTELLKRAFLALAQCLIALWQFVRDGIMPEGIFLRPAQ
jgi:hypothetical protein